LQIETVQRRDQSDEPSVISFNSIRIAQKEVTIIGENIERRQSKIKVRTEEDAPFELCEDGIYRTVGRQQPAREPWWWRPSGYENGNGIEDPFGLEDPSDFTYTGLLEEDEPNNALVQEEDLYGLA